MSEFETSKEDGALIAALREGLGASDPVPGDVSEFAKATFAWRDIDAALAELAFDSAEEDLPSGVRSAATARMLSFQAGQWMIDVEFDEASGRVIGAISPEAAYTVEIHSPGAYFTADSDEQGRFEAAGVSPGALSLVLRFTHGPVVKTQWVVL